ncbi:MAG: hypothetical protein WAV47_14595, partial [Blastocatellia bacterium]
CRLEREALTPDGCEHLRALAGCVGWNVKLSRLTAVSIFEYCPCRLERESLTPDGCEHLRVLPGRVGWNLKLSRLTAVSIFEHWPAV